MAQDAGVDIEKMLNIESGREAAALGPGRDVGDELHETTMRGISIEAFLAELVHEQRQKQTQDWERANYAEPQDYVADVMELARGTGACVLEKLCLVLAEWRGWV